jgi:methylenetetrahydrofolate dehydrogenase (NADP+)/methenyltetrahydrofolate cyclohydrolase
MKSCNRGLKFGIICHMIIDGKKIADELLEALKQEIAALPGRPPCLKVILIGTHPASTLYVSRKKAAATRIGIDAEVIAFPDSISQKELLQTLERLNRDPSVDGIIVQLPLPPQIASDKVLDTLDPEKDVDGFCPVNQGRLLAGSPHGFIPATPLGIQTLLIASGVNPKGKRVVIVGRSAIVGRPLFALLSQKGAGGDATVTLAHSQTPDLAKITREADILIAAVGSPQLIQASHVKPGAVVIDVGINRADGKLVGDVDFEAVEPIASLITPVPGGVGPMTIYSLLLNTFKARKNTLAP